MKETSVRITVLVDNSIMELIPDSSVVRRVSVPGAHFRAEHGLSLLIETPDARILMDTGATGEGMREGLAAIKVPLSDIDTFFLSHGHYDHAGGLGMIPGQVVAHPDVVYPRYLTKKDGGMQDIGIRGRFDPDVFDFQRGPFNLAPGVRTTGEVERFREWETPRNLWMEVDDEMRDDQVMDDQAIMVNTPLGLIVVAGCAHAGILNTIDHCRKVSGVEDVYLVVGGFHLIGASHERIERTAQGLRDESVEKILPIHCTGFEAQRQLSLEIPDAYEYCTAGCVVEIQ